jgi:outer membrane receptor protein involved in Fe transport
MSLTGSWHSRTVAIRVLRRVGRAGVALLFASMAPGAARAQAPGIIDGVLVVRGTGTPIGEAQVFIEGTRLGSASDATGRFRIVGVPAGDHVLVAQRIGINTERRPITVVADSVTYVRLELGETAAVMAPVVVSATRERQRANESSATITALDGAEIRRTRAAHPSGILNRVPGVYVSQLSGEGHSTAIRQPISTKPLYLYLEDGVPTRSTGFFNHNALYEVNLPQSSGLEVLKGPGTALYGSDAIGGIVNVLTRQAPLAPTVELGLERGEDGYTRFLGSAGSAFGVHALRADLNITRSDGWRDDAEYRRESGTLRWDFFAPGGWTIKSVLAASLVDQQELVALPEDAFESRPELNLSPIGFREVRAIRLSAAIEREKGPSLWSFTPYARDNVLEILPTWQLTFDPQVWDTRSRSYGVLARYRRNLAPLKTRVIIGADVEVSPGSFTADGIAAERSGPEGSWSSFSMVERHYDYDVTYRAFSPYAHAEVSPTSRVRVDAGLRYDVSGYDYATKQDPLATGRHRRPADTDVTYHQVSPKVGVTVDLHRAASFFASYREGFRAPSQSQLFQQNAADNTVDLQPVKVVSYEVGMRGQLGQRLLYQLSAYDMRLTDDIITLLVVDGASASRIATNAGETRHRGIEAGLGLALLPSVRLDASFAVSEQEYVDWVPTVGSRRVDYSGNAIEAAPEQLGNVLLTLSPSFLAGGRAAVEWSMVGRYWMDPDNSRRYAGHDLINLHANYFVTPSTELFARLSNLTGERFAELATFDAVQGATYVPGAPRALFAGVRYNWQRSNREPGQ